MTPPAAREGGRREFLAGDVLRRELEEARDGGGARPSAAPADEVAVAVPRAGDTLRVQARAMACHFAVFLDADRRDQLALAAESLEGVEPLEALMTVYRPGSEMSQANAAAADGPVVLDETLYEVVSLACRIGQETGGRFDPTAGSLVALWRECRAAGRVPGETEIDQTRGRGGLGDIRLDPEHHSIRFARPGVEINLGGIGKGFALDRIGGDLADKGADAWLIHGGHSSLLAKGGHAGHDGWPVGVRNPLFPTRRLATLLLDDTAMATSGSGVELFRISGTRYGHILDPRSGRPAEGLLSVTVLAETAARADALATAFYVGGVDYARGYCDNHPGISALLVPPPRRGQTLEPVVCGIPEEVLFFEDAGERP